MIDKSPRVEARHPHPDGTREEMDLEPIAHSSAMPDRDITMREYRATCPRDQTVVHVMVGELSTDPDQAGL